MLVTLQKSLIKHSTIFLSGLLSGGLLVGFFVLSPLQAQDDHSHWVTQLAEDKAEVAQLKAQSEQTFSNLVRKIGSLQAQAINLQTQSHRMAQMLDVNLETPLADEYPAAYHLGQEQADLNLFAALASLEYRLLQRTQQLNALESLADAKLLHDKTKLEGNPQIVKGWISSYFGTRVDPLTGKKKWHSGVDIGSPQGREVKAVATGVVTFAGEKGGYGNLLEISHGNGLVTRYGHNDALLVSAGDIVHKGKSIALVGKTGRATGPHVHFEVREHGQAVDPGKYFPKLSRNA